MPITASQELTVETVYSISPPLGLVRAISKDICDRYTKEASTDSSKRNGPDGHEDDRCDRGPTICGFLDNNSFYHE